MNKNCIAAHSVEWTVRLSVELVEGNSVSIGVESGRGDMIMMNVNYSLTSVIWWQSNQHEAI